VSSCGLEQWEDEGGLDFNSSLTTNLSQEERVIAARICSAYQAKRKTKLESGASYTANISTNKRFCKNNDQGKAGEEDKFLAELKLISRAQGATFDVSPSVDIYLKNIETDEHGLVSNICQQIFENENTIKRNITIQFSRRGQYDVYEVVRKIGEQNILEEFKVDVDQEPFYGLVKEYSQTIQCPEGSQISKAISTQTIESISN